MHSLYKVGQPKPLTQTEITHIEQTVDFPLPVDYKDFLTQYGYGEINELLMVETPDEKFIQNNFSDYMHFWEWEENDTLQKTLNGLTIGRTIDGDIVVIINNPANPIIILPRHSQLPLFFLSFQAVIQYYNITYELGNNLYFDTDDNAVRKYISLHADNRPDHSLMAKLHQTFLEKFIFDRKFDRALNFDKQPKYIIQKIGGWIYFDLLSGGAIRVKYQSRFDNEANHLINFLDNFMAQYGG